MIIEKIGDIINNSLPMGIENKLLVGIIGETPSKTARSPYIWNPTFEELGIDAIFLSFDVVKENLENLVKSLKEDERVQGFSVTNPYKTDIIKFLDEVEERASMIKAINTVVRTSEGKLIGYNTDGQGFIDSLTTLHPKKSNPEHPFINNLAGRKILLIGAGGAARAIAFYLSSEIKDGSLYIVNRNKEKAESILDDIRKNYNVEIKADSETCIINYLSEVNLIINASTKGSSGLKKVNGKYTSLIGYSALSEANPEIVERNEGESDEDLEKRIFDLSYKNRKENRHDSTVMILHDICYKKRYPSFVDIIFNPLETEMLEQAKRVGYDKYPIMNGLGMNVFQAVNSFKKMMKTYLRLHNLDNEEIYSKIQEIMFSS